MACRNSVASEEFADFIAPYFTSPENFMRSQGTDCIDFVNSTLAVVYIPFSTITSFSYTSYTYSAIPKLYSLLDVTSMDAAGITAAGELPVLNNQGEGVLIGFVDTGIHYMDPLFRSADGSTRIIGIWDQTLPPSSETSSFFPVLYGCQYTAAQINLALNSDDPASIVPTRDENGHGTFLASIAAGNRDERAGFSGAAPRASIAMVKLKPAKQYLRDFYLIRDGADAYQENDILAGLRYLNELARRREMPLVICMAIGTSFGGHNGDSLLAGVLDGYALLRNRCVVTGTGNEAAQRHHYYGTFTEAQNIQTAEIRVGEGVKGFVTELWSTLPNIVTVSITSPSGERTGQIPVRLGYLFDFVFAFERTAVTVEYRLLQENSDAQLVFIRLQKAVPGIWKIEVKPVMQTKGEFHMWLPMKEFLDGEVYFLESNPDTTFTEPAGGEHTMTVSYYNSQENTVDINSGRGYTRDERIKPDYAAPGVVVTGAVPGGGFKERTGSSAATAIAAGGCALIMKWISDQPGAGGASASQVRNVIVMGAQKLPAIEYPNTQWGYGTMNLYHSLDILRRL